MKLPRPGAHNHIEGAPPESFAFVAELGSMAPLLEMHKRLEDLSDEGTRRALDLPATFTVRFTYKRKGHPRAALDSVLKDIHPSVFETEVLDA
jgi:hypothetical protein